jgi:hypothetical protein
LNFSITHKVSSDADTPISATPVETGSNSYTCDITFPAGSTNVALPGAFTNTALQTCFMLADSNLTLKTNSSGSPANTFNLVAGRPLVWAVSDGYFSNPFTSSVTSFFVTCTTSSRLRIKILLT